MNYYLSKYVGTYRIKAEVNQSTNDFCRDKNGNLNNNNDVYIKCANDIRIYHYGGNVLSIYIPSIQKGRNLLRQFCHENNIGNVTIDVVSITDKNGKTKERITYKSDVSIEELYKLIKDNNIIFDILESDSEVEFKIKDKDLEKIVDILKPQTSGASISPFSPKNLTKQKYEYTPTQIDIYNKITSIIPKEDKLLIGRINNEFVSEILCKKYKKDINEIKTDMKKEQLKLRDYIYFKGYENEYLEYLKINIPLKLN